MLLASLVLAYLSLPTQATATSAASTTAQRDARRPNVVYILADDLGWGELGCYGQTKIQTPNLDRLRSEGMRFTQHYSGSAVCAPSRCVLLTGKHTGHAIVRDNWENGGWGADAPEGQYPLPEGTPNLASLLKSNGYATAVVGKWGLGGPETSGHPNRQGFDHFFGYLCQRKAHNYYPTHLWHNENKFVLEGNGDFYPAHQKIKSPLDTDEEYWERYNRKDFAPDYMIASALDFVREHEQEPFFLYYATPIPHVALQIPPERLEQYPEEWDEKHYLGDKAYLPHPYPNRAYAAMISTMDDNIGQILNLLEELGLSEDTIVVFSSDNGPTYAGGVDMKFFDSQAGLRGQKGTLWEGGIRVPLLVRWPDKVQANSESEHVSAFQDTLPTLVDLLEIDSEIKTDGISFANTLLGQAEQAQHPALYWEFRARGHQALRMGRWKAIRPNLKKSSLEIELYDLDEDPNETTNLATEHPELIERATELFKSSRVASEVYPVPALD